MSSGKWMQPVVIEDAGIENAVIEDLEECTNDEDEYSDDGDEYAIVMLYCTAFSAYRLAKNTGGRPGQGQRRYQEPDREVKVPGFPSPEAKIPETALGRGSGGIRHIFENG